MQMRAYIKSSLSLGSTKKETMTWLCHVDITVYSQSHEKKSCGYSTKRNIRRRNIRARNFVRSSFYILYHPTCCYREAEMAGKRTKDRWYKIERKRGRETPERGESEKE
ncbi:uncharacterized protein LOC109611417 [Ooceraea biroi]|uniref:uncharacterized protein LOC109611417 n=1 Tax=Ooceraea biroi TaxID=2015173 RepID=UPI000F094B90|nr:uncharacterized protein LOC109611417 [Ooceraea biroi]